MTIRLSLANTRLQTGAKFKKEQSYKDVMRSLAQGQLPKVQ